MYCEWSWTQENPLEYMDSGSVSSMKVLQQTRLLRLASGQARRKSATLLKCGTSRTLPVAKEPGSGMAPPVESGRRPSESAGLKSFGRSTDTCQWHGLPLHSPLSRRVAPRLNDSFRE